MEQKWKRYFGLMLAALLIACVYVFYLISGSSVSGDLKLKMAIQQGDTRVAPEQLNLTDWVFWCISADPGQLSGSTELVAAATFAKENNLSFSGANKKTYNTHTWPAIFIDKSGGYQTLDFVDYSFNWEHGDELCWMRGRSVVRIENNKVLKVEAENE